VSARLPLKGGASTLDLSRFDTRPPAGHTRALAVARTSEAPVIDGKLDDAAWQKAPVAERFWISEQQRVPSEKTEVLVTADRDRLYVAFRVFDARPDTIEALQVRRNVGLGVDDQVGIELDTYANSREISTYAVNARGTQYDDVAYGRADNIAWRGDWQAATVRTPYGWSAEMAIPFSILNYQPGSHTFRVNFIRYHARTSEWSRWADVTPQYKVEEMGQLTGLDLPPVAKAQPWSFMPYVLVGKNIPDKRGEFHDTLANAGVDIRYQPRPHATAVFSLNPDFSQIETQFTNINFAYTEKPRLDPRPFFQEGASYFGMDQSYFYSNRVPNFDLGAKYFSQLGPYQLGVLATRAPDDRADYVVRTVRELDRTNSAGVMIVGSERKDLSHQLVAGQLAGRQPSGFNYALDGAVTNSSQAGGDGTRGRASAGWRWDHWSVGTALDRMSTDFVPANGLIAADVPGTRGAYGGINYFRDLPSGTLRSMNAAVSWTGRNTEDGRTQLRSWSGGGSVELREQQIRTSLYATSGLYRPVTSTRGVWSDTVNHDHYWTAAVDFNTRSSWLGYGATYSSGFLGGGDYSYAAPYVWVRPTDRTWVNVSTERLMSFGDFDQTIVAARWDVTDQDSLAARYVLSDGQQFFRLAFARQVRKGLDVFSLYEAGALMKPSLSAKFVMSFP
jgi:hypothetical protein